MTMTPSNLRRPNFNLSRGGISKDVASSAAYIARGGTPNAMLSTTATETTSAQSLATFSRACHKLLASSMHPVHGIHSDDDGQDLHRVHTSISDPSSSSSSTSTGGLGNKKISGNSNNNDTTPTLDQCIILLEPILKIFQTNCIMNDEAKKKLQKRQQRQFGTVGGHAEEGTTNTRAYHDNEEEDGDEIPPQLLRAAKFFPYRFIPMKRALLRPPPVSWSGGNQQKYPKNETINEASDSGIAELSLHYRLRLVRACWKRGLVAAAEYETLQKSIERTSTSKKRKNRSNDVEAMKRYSTLEEEDDEFDDETKSILMERVRLSFLRLPTEAIHPHRSISALNHVKEMVSQCFALLEKDTDEDVKSKSRTANQVADWAMTSWTAVLLVRGLDCIVAPPLDDNSISSIERQLAILLTNRGTSSGMNNPAAVLSRAVECRISILLRPENIQCLNGIHLYSLGRLLASFHNRDDAIMHVAVSLCQCAMESGGMLGFEQLSRLLAVFLCCLATTSSFSMDENGTKSSSAVGDIDATLRAKLDDDEFMTSMVNVLDSTDGRIGRHSPSSVKRKAKTFLEAVFSTAAHIIQCCE